MYGELGVLSFPSGWLERTQEVEVHAWEPVIVALKPLSGNLNVLFCP